MESILFCFFLQMQRVGEGSYLGSFHKVGRTLPMASKLRHVKVGACWTSRGPRKLLILAPQEVACPQMIQVTHDRQRLRRHGQYLSMKIRSHLTQRSTLIYERIANFGVVDSQAPLKTLLSNSQLLVRGFHETFF